MSDFASALCLAIVLRAEYKHVKSRNSPLCILVREGYDAFSSLRPKFQTAIFPVNMGQSLTRNSFIIIKERTIESFCFFRQITLNIWVE